MKFQKIMVPFDGSELAVKALDAALDLASGFDDAQVYAVSIISPGGLEMGMSSLEAYEASLATLLEESKKKLVAQMNDLVGEHSSVKIEAITDHSPIRGIIRFADVNEIDLIIMGHRGMGAIRTFFGSVATGVTHEAKCPVMIVK